MTRFPRLSLPIRIAAIAAAALLLMLLFLGGPPLLLIWLVILVGLGLCIASVIP